MIAASIANTAAHAALFVVCLLIAAYLALAITTD